MSGTARARLSPFVAVNLGIRFLLEILMLVALAWAGAELGSAWPASLALGIAFPLAAALVWGLCVAPKASRRLSDPARLIVELALFAAASVAVGLVADPWLALTFATMVAVNTAVLRLSRVEH